MKIAIIISALFAGIIALLMILTQVSKDESFQFFGELTSRVEVDEKLVALTFDDGPTKGKTNEILSILDENNAKATFYLVGEAISENMEEAKLIVESGHEVGNHSYTHERMMAKNYAFMDKEITKTDEQIRKAGYSGEITFRPPYGRKLFVLPYYLQKKGIHSVTWDVEPDSALPLNASPDDLVEHAEKNVKPGSIILMHVMFNSRANSMSAIAKMILRLKANGYRFVTVSELLRARS